MKKHMQTVKTLMESFPYIREFYGKTLVIKYGGNAMIDETLKESFSKDMALLKLVGINPVIVHGGGPQIGNMLKKIGKESEFRGGMRVTDDETMAVAEMVLVGQVNKEIVHYINKAGGRAVGLSGKDGSLIEAEKLYHEAEGIKTDIGLVGSVKNINSAVLKTLDKDRFIPVIAPIGFGADGKTYNINADIAAGKIAESLNAEKLILLTDTEGVKVNDNLASSLKINEVKDLIKKNIITGGMIPKTNCCVEALEGGVHKTHIIDGRIEHAVLLEVFTDAGIGTQILA